MDLTCQHYGEEVANEAAIFCANCGLRPAQDEAIVETGDDPDAGDTDPDAGDTDADGRAGFLAAVDARHERTARPLSQPEGDTISRCSSADRIVEACDADIDEYRWQLQTATTDAQAVAHLDPADPARRSADLRLREVAAAWKHAQKASDRARHVRNALLTSWEQALHAPGAYPSDWR